MQLNKVGVIGLGKMGLLHFGILNTLSNVQLISIADTDKNILNYIKDLNSEVYTYDNGSDMIDREELDAVFICTPSFTHAELSISCINNGINFFIEKPLSNTLESSIKLINKLKLTNLINQVGYSCIHFMPTFAKAKKLLDANIVGKIAHFSSSMYLSQTFTQEKSWKYKKDLAGGGVLINLASHLVYALIWFFGELQSVNAHTTKLYSVEVEDFCSVLFNFKNGVIGSLDTSWSVPGYRNPEMSINIHGDNGIMNITSDFIKLHLNNPYKDFNEGWNTIYKQDLYSGLDFFLASEEYVREDSHFIDCVTNHNPTLVDCYIGYEVQKTIHDIYRTAI